MKKSILESLSIRNYRSFEEIEMNFAIPNGKLGSGLTIISGPNNCGKTSLLEALTLNSESTISLGERRNQATSIVKFSFTINREKKLITLKNIDQGSQLSIENTTDVLPKNAFEIISSRRNWNCSIPPYRRELNTLGDLTSKNIRNIDRNNVNNNFSAILKSININSQQKRIFTELIKTLVPSLTSWTVETNEEGVDYVKYITADGLSHKTDNLGDGTISLFRICTHLVLDSDSILVIDEPELSLHPSAQKQLRKILLEKSHNRQIIISTHSAYFIGWEYLETGTKIFRLNKHHDKVSSVHELTYEMMEEIVGFNNPLRHHLFDLVAKEIMFAVKLLFVEGQEDVGIIQNWTLKNNKIFNFDIFGYGANGWKNFRAFLKVCNILGIEKVACLYDKGTERDIHPDRGILLNDDFIRNKSAYPNYKILQLETADIRDKKNGKKEGTFDKEGNIKPEYEEGFNKIINTLEEYFQD